MSNCKMCSRTAVATFALVPLCGEHRKKIVTETKRYYQYKISRSERVLYSKIAKFIPWRNKS